MSNPCKFFFVLSLFLCSCAVEYAANGSQITHSRIGTVESYNCPVDNNEFYSIAQHHRIQMIARTKNKTFINEVVDSIESLREAGECIESKQGIALTPRSIEYSRIRPFGSHYTLNGRSVTTDTTSCTVIRIGFSSSENGITSLFYETGGLTEKYAIDRVMEELIGVVCRQ
jgi:hypothetical protein